MRFARRRIGSHGDCDRMIRQLEELESGEFSDRVEQLFECPLEQLNLSDLARLGLQLKPAERLRGLEETLEEMRRYLDRAASARAAPETGDRETQGSRSRGT